jgi:hypothetical protein
MGLLNTLVAVWTVHFPLPEVVAEVGSLHNMLCLPEHGLIAIGRDSIMDEADG